MKKIELAAETVLKKLSKDFEPIGRGWFENRSLSNVLRFELVTNKYDETFLVFRPPTKIFPLKQRRFAYQSGFSEKSLRNFYEKFKNIGN